jgi:glycosyltransferase A (GT-A) superfamily protein (DUF2064 family)
VKTRLLAAVPAEVVAALHEACIADTLRLVRKMRGCDVIVFAGGGTDYFRKRVKEQRKGGHVRVLPQRWADLGARMEERAGMAGRQDGGATRIYLIQPPAKTVSWL